MHDRTPKQIIDPMRKRLGNQDFHALFALSVHMHGKKLAKAKEVLVGTIVQEKNSTYPTDAKLYKVARHVKQTKKALKKLSTLAGRQVKVGKSEVILPGCCQGQRASVRHEHKLRCQRAIEAIIGHLKSAHRLSRNYLKGIVRDGMNTLLEGIGFNVSLLLRVV